MDLAVETRGLTKSFGSLVAVHHVDFSAAKGEIHAVIGENGAGKSTFMNLLNGTIAPTSGAIGKPANPNLDVATVHQHFMLASALTVRENILLKLQREGFWLKSDVVESTLRLEQELGWEIDPEARVADLPVGIQQKLEILAALQLERDILILDEPTAVLSQHEVDELFRVLQDLKSRGKTILLIAHKLDEVLAVADRISVMRGGRMIATLVATNSTAAELAMLMVGELLQPVSRQNEPILNEIQLEVAQLTVRGDRGNEAVRGLSFHVAAGQVLGIGGVDGNGQLELAEALAGIRTYSGSVVYAKGRGSRVAYISQDRHRDGLALDMTVLENGLIELARGRGGPLNPNACREHIEEIVRTYDVRTTSLDQPVRSLSGGNQQKLIVGRTLASSPDVIIAVNPTRGLDVRAAMAVHTFLRKQSARGAAIVLITSDLDELFEASDEIKFLSRGTLQDRHDAAVPPEPGT